jgi:hypothetical protein
LAARGPTCAPGAQELLRHSPVPVMIVRPSERVEAVDTGSEPDLQEQTDTRP